MTKSDAGPVRLVCFDLGGVLVRICRDWAQGCAAAGVDVRRTPDDPQRLHLAITNEHQRGALDMAGFAQQLARTLGGVYTPEEVERIHCAWLCGEYEGVDRVIERIHGAGVETACLSNTNAAHWESLVRYPSLRLLRHLHASHLLGLVKPDGACYAAFEAATGRAPGEILFFEDTAENAEAAVRRGWRAVVVDPLRETAPQIERALVEHGVL